MKNVKRLFSIALFFAAFFAFSIVAGASTHGDCDLDGAVTSADARLALRAAVELETLSEEKLRIADVDASGDVTSADARLILRIVVALESPDAYHTFYEANDGKPVCSVCGKENDEIFVGGKYLCLNENLSLLEKGFERIHHPYVFLNDESFTDEYGNYVLALITQSGWVRHLYICGDDFIVGDVASGDVITNEAEKNAVLSDGSMVYYFTDANDSDMVYAALIYSDEPVYVDNHAVNYGAEYVETDITNAFRALYGLKALKFNEGVADVARAHSRDMAENDYFDHYSLNGDAPWDRAQKAGIQFYGYGENIAAGAFMPWEVFDLWVNSAGHRENILSDFDDIGIGLWIDEASDYGFYWTQNFMS